MFPTEEEQITQIDGPKSAEPAPFGFFASQEDIDTALQEWNGSIDSKRAVVRYMRDHAREKGTADWLRQEYGDDLPAFPVTTGNAAADLPWSKVQRRLAQLIKEDRFYTQEELDNLEDIDPIEIRDRLAQNGIVNSEVVDPEVLDRDPFIRMVEADAQRVDETQSQNITNTVAVYPGEKNNLPYDVVIQTIRTDVQNFQISNDSLGVGGPKAKYQDNIQAIKLLKQLEADGKQALPEQQEILSRYVGWGGLADAFGPDKESWNKEYTELKDLLTPEEYAAARSSTLNAHYTSPTVIKAIYEAVENMGWKIMRQLLLQIGKIP